MFCISRSKASSIIGDAEQKSKLIVEEARNTAKDEAAKIAKSSAQQLEQEINAARETLKADVAELSIVCAERVLQSEVDKQKHNKIIDEVINSD